MPKTRLGSRRVGGTIGKGRGGKRSAKQLAALRKATMVSARKRHERAVQQWWGDNKATDFDDYNRPSRTPGPQLKKVPMGKQIRKMEQARRVRATEKAKVRVLADAEWSTWLKKTGYNNIRGLSERTHPHIYAEYTNRRK